MKYDDVLEKLNMYMVEDFVSVDANRNPVATRLKNAGSEQLKNILFQYCIFPRNIVGFLVKAFYRINNANWEDLSNEIKRNINEELGSETKNRSHYNILFRSILDSLNIDITQTIPSHSTKVFVDQMTAALDDPDPSFVAGAIYALESSAVKELEIVFTLAKSLFRKTESKMPKSLEFFFNIHINDLEIGHEEGLRTTCKKHIKNEKQIKVFKSGFKKVMETMDDWWIGLGNEMNVA